MIRRPMLLLLALAAAVACENGGASRTLGISATGTVLGEIYFDANGSRSRDPSDVAFAGARIRLLSPGGTDTLHRATTAVDGIFRLTNIPVGTYVVIVDSASVGDSAQVLDDIPVSVTVLPGDTVEFQGAVSYPVYTIPEARALAPGVRLFVRGIALHGRTTFSDTTVHIVDDAGGAMRATRVRPAAVEVLAGDSVMLRARIAERLGQRVLDDVTPFVIGTTFIPTAPILTTLTVETGGLAGSLDAALVRLVDVLVTDTVTVLGNMQLSVDDGSGQATVILDRTADIGFQQPLPPGLFIPGARFDITGVLVPTGAGTWRLKPRSALDLTPR
jgi:hypothetical protein